MRFLALPPLVQTLLSAPLNLVCEPTLFFGWSKCFKLKHKQKARREYVCHIDRRTTDLVLPVATAALLGWASGCRDWGFNKIIVIILQPLQVLVVLLPPLEDIQWGKIIYGNICTGKRCSRPESISRHECIYSVAYINFTSQSRLSMYQYLKDTIWCVDSFADVVVVVGGGAMIT